ncbi:MAG: protein kinase, partial [Victivallales bacterium]|nr:protein kinase [Victivallales bacterium]
MNSYSCPHCHQDFEIAPSESEEVVCPHCNGMVSVPERDLEPGERLGGFEIMHLIGRGGMGNVYMAIQLSMNRPVALKVLLKSMTQDKEALRQFLNEARVSGQMNHRNIISAIDAGEIDDNYFLVTAFVDGEDLERRLERDSQIPEKEALDIALKIGDALNYAWENYKLLHKDIKPGNIMTDSRGEVFLMDMGIAQFAGDSALDGG